MKIYKHSINNVDLNSTNTHKNITGANHSMVVEGNVLQSWGNLLLQQTLMSPVESWPVQFLESPATERCHDRQPKYGSELKIARQKTTHKPIVSFYAK